MITFLLLALTTLTVDDIPVVSDPVMVCIHTTLKADGSTAESLVASGSGNAKADLYALKIVRIIKIKRYSDETYSDEEGYVLVEVSKDGGFGASIMDNGGKLLRSCSLPTDSSAQGT
jgi:hypothetical protein